MTPPASAATLDDVVIDQRLVDEKLVEAGAAWEATATALLRVLGVADAFGLLPAEREALDVALVQAARVAARGQSVAFHAGLRIGAARRNQLTPRGSQPSFAMSAPATDRPTLPAEAGDGPPQPQSTSRAINVSQTIGRRRAVMLGSPDCGGPRASARRLARSAKDRGVGRIVRELADESTSI